MKELTHILQLAVIGVLVALSSASIVKSPEVPDETFELLILHNNDMHARFEQTSQLSGACTVADRDAGKCYGGFPRVATVVKEARKAAVSGEGPPVLYLNAGDTYTGTAWFTIYKWKVAAEFLNALQPDAVSLGNHEFDEEVKGLIPFIRNVTAPVLAANLQLDEVPELEKEPNFYKSITVNIRGIDVGIIGYLTPDTKFLAPKNKVKYEDEVTAIKREVSTLKEKGVKIFIAVGHSGFLKDLEIAKQVEDLDLVIGGHSNTFLTNDEHTNETPEIPQGPYPTVVKQNSGRTVLVVQAYAYTKYMGKLYLKFDKRGNIIHYSGYPLLLTQNITEDMEVLQKVNKYRKNVDVINNEVVGSSKIFLDAKECRLRECNMGNFISGAMLNYTREYYPEFSDATIAIIQGGRIRASINRDKKPFQLTRGDWMTVMPYSDTMCVMTMNGTILRQALEHAVSVWRKIDTPGQFLQISGMEVTYDLARDPGSRVIEAKAMCSTCSEVEDISDEKVYKVITSTFIGDGGDGYAMFESLPKSILVYNEISCILDSLSKYSPIEPLISNKIIILNEPNEEDKVTGTSSRAENSYFNSAIYIVMVATLLLSL